jgi:Uma2 family endonuclease
MIAKLWSPPPVVEYPEDNGEPMSEGTLQFRWIVTIVGGFRARYRNDPNVLVAGDLLWYPVEGNNKISRAPDAMIALGRPNGDRRSYLQWLEGGIAPQVVWEVLSPSNRGSELAKKFAFYQKYGVEEYYIYDPDYGKLSGWLRIDGTLQPIPNIQGWTSPRTGVTMSLDGVTLVLIGPDGRRFLSFEELVAVAERGEIERLAAVHAANAAQQLAEQQRLRVEQERQRAEQERQRAEQEHQRAEQLLAQLRALGVEPQPPTGAGGP